MAFFTSMAKLNKFWDFGQQNACRNQPAIIGIDLPKCQLQGDSSN